MNETESKNLSYLGEFAERQLHDHIMPFWRKHAPDLKRGGFHGQINNDMSLVPEAVKGQILNARILWTFSAVYRKFKNPEDLQLARRAYEYIIAFFFDPQFGGYYWSLKPDGTPADTKKQIYAQAFVIYALSEYFKVTGDQAVLQKAIDLFRLIEKHSFDNRNNGYIEARNREWKEMADIRLSEKDMNVAKSMNTHLHILEAYANLHTVWKDPLLKKQLENLIRIFADKIIDSNDHHQLLFFDESWNSQSTHISFGHDIETSWLLHEAAHILGNQELTERITDIALKMSHAVKKGFAPGGALYYEADRKGQHQENEIEWWAQSEAVVGYLNAYMLKRDPADLEIACTVARFIEKYIVDKVNGEWFFRVTDEGKPIMKYEKAGFWKCPYHNARTCLEITHRLQLLKNK